MRSIQKTLILFLLLTPLCSAEYRMFWVDIWHKGVRTQAEADAMLAAAVKAKSNALMIAVRGEGYAYFLKRIEPLPQAGWVYQPGFDAISYITDKGHTLGLEVHAWMDITPLWNPDRGYKPPDPAHKWNRHGRHATGSDLWITATERSNYMHGMVDLGHPGAAKHIADVIVDPLRHYNLDGIHLDYIRYPYAVDRTNDGRWNPEFFGWNPTSIERFNRLNGRSGKPAQSDSAWQNWRRAQVTQFVRQVYLRAKEIRPSAKVSAAVAVWGVPPSGEDFQSTEPYQVGFQDWHAWLQEGIIDFVTPMLYRDDSDASSKANFDAWLKWLAEHKHGREVVPGLGNYMNSPTSTLAQAGRVLDHPGDFAGFALFSYANTNNSGTTNDGFYTRLGSWRSAGEIPSFPWLRSPSVGSIAGQVAAAQGSSADGLAFEIRRSGDNGVVKTGSTDGTGFFGATRLQPGSYYVALSRAGAQVFRSGNTSVHAGAVARVDMNLNGCTFSVGPNAVAVAATGGVARWNVTASGATCAWTAGAGPSWGALTGAANRSGSATVEYAIQSNTGTARTATVTIAGTSVTVSQAAGSPSSSPAQCTYSLSKPSVWMPASGGIATVTVTASSPTCQWSAGTGYSWGLKLAGSPNRTGSAILEYSFARNTGTARAGYVAIAGKSINMGQQAATEPAPCTFTVSSPAVWMPAAGGLATIRVTASAPTCEWTAGTGYSWGLALVGPSMRTGTATLQYSFTKNTGPVRAGYIRIAGHSVNMGQFAGTN